MLDDRIKARILDDHKKLTADGKLLSRSQLEGYYRTFRSRFGPDVLARLDGEELLETMHAHGNKDSLVYWLEFKNDDEFPAHFGSIAGGSAFKFGVFRRKETGIWVTADEKNARETSRLQGRRSRHRADAPGPVAPGCGALLRAALEPLVVVVSPVRGRRRLDRAVTNRQANLDKDAPDVSNLAWGHKYFSLTYPGDARRLPSKLPSRHQRFHLIKMLQVPPEGHGRYLCAGRYVAAARELGIPINHLTTTLNHHNSRTPHSLPADRHVRRREAVGTDGRPDGTQDGACVAP